MSVMKRFSPAAPFLSTRNHGGTPVSAVSRRQLLKGLGLSVGAGAVGAPRRTGAQGAAKAVTLTYVNYSAGVDKAMWDSLIAEFSKLHPNITVKYQPVPGESWGDYFDKLATMIAGGNPPDVSRVAIEGTRLVVSRGLATPLDEFMKGDPEIDEYLKDVSPRLLEVFRVDGKTYELPFDWNNMVMYYNTKMLQQAGLQPPRKEWTKDEFLEMAQKLTRRSGSGDPEVFGFGFAVQYFSGTIPWMYANGTSLLSADLTKSNLKDPRVLEVLQFLQDLVWKHKVSPKPPASHADIYSLMAAGKIAMAGGGRWPVLQMTKAGFSDFDVQYFPRWKEQITEYGVGGFVIMKSTKHPEEAWKWVKFLTSKRALEILTRIGQAIPARRSIAASPAMFELPPKNAKIFYESIEGTNARPVPSPSTYNRIESTWRRYLGRVLANEMAPAAALEEADKEFTAILAGA
jgi:multiple sugar transport system substrate-binding protein